MKLLLQTLLSKTGLIKVVVPCAVLSLASTAFAGGNVEAGKQKAQQNNCASCHGADFNSPIDPSYPKLAGQHQDYLVQALTQYQRGDKAVGANLARANAIMSGQAKPLSKQDIEDIASYLHSLPGGLLVPPYTNTR
jgi:cytochrome c553